MPSRAKVATIALIGLVSAISAAFVWEVSAIGDGEIFESSSWNSANPENGAVVIIHVVLFSIFNMATRFRSKEMG